MKVGDVDTSPNARAEAHAATIVSAWCRARRLRVRGRRACAARRRDACRRRGRAGAARTGGGGLDLQRSTVQDRGPLHVRDGALCRTGRSERRHADFAFSERAGGPLTSFKRFLAWWTLAEKAASRLTMPPCDVARSDVEVARLLTAVLAVRDRALGRRESRSRVERLAHVAVAATLRSGTGAGVDDRSRARGRVRRARERRDGARAPDDRTAGNPLARVAPASDGGCRRRPCGRGRGAHCPRARRHPTVTSRPIRVLALSPIPEEGAGCRFRIAQFIPYLESVGISVTLNSLFTPEFFRLVYKRGHYLRKAVTFAALSLKRLDSLRDSPQFDLDFHLPGDLPDWSRRRSNVCSRCAAGRQSSSTSTMRSFCRA